MWKRKKIIDRLKMHVKEKENEWEIVSGMWKRKKIGVCVCVCVWEREREREREREEFVKI
jgi:chorismate synthase